jgi:hypothetical protein
MGQWRADHPSALDSLIERIYSQLRQLADKALVDDWGNKSLQPTELVHEACLRLPRMWIGRIGRTFSA